MILQPLRKLMFRPSVGRLDRWKFPYTVFKFLARSAASCECNASSPQVHPSTTMGGCDCVDALMPQASPGFLHRFLVSCFATRKGAVKDLIFACHQLLNHRAW